MRVQLLQPPAKGLKDQRAYPPLGLMYLASNVNNFGDLIFENLKLFSFPFDISNLSVLLSKNKISFLFKNL